MTRHPFRLITPQVRARAIQAIQEAPHQTLLFAALWISEGWYERWRMNGRLHYKARGIVLFDRVLNGEIQ